MGLLYSGGAIITKNIFQLISVAILSRLLTPNDFGVYSIITVLYSFSLIFSEFGVVSAIIQKKDLNEHHVNAAKIFTLFMGVFFTSIFFIFSENISLLLNSTYLSKYIKIFSIIFILKSFSLINEAILRKRLKFKKLILIEIISYIFGNFSISIICALLGFGVISVIAGLIAQVTISLILINRDLGFNFQFVKFKFFKQHISGLLNFGVPFTFGRFFMFLGNQADNLIIGKYAGLVDLGFYNRSFQLMKTPVEFVGGTLSKVLFPVFSKIKDNKNQLKDVFLTSNFISSLFLMPLTVFLIYAAKPIIIIVLGDQWESAIPIFQILSSTLFVRVGYKFVDPLINATGNQVLKARVQFFYASLIIISSIIGVKYSIEIVGILVSVSVFIHFILMNIIACKELSITIWDYISSIRVGILATVLFTILLWLTRGIIDGFIFKTLIQSVILLLMTYFVLWLLYKEQIMKIYYGK